jgi:hypothetical protein
MAPWLTVEAQASRELVVSWSHPARPVRDHPVVPLPESASPGAWLVSSVVCRRPGIGKGLALSCPVPASALSLPSRRRNQVRAGASLFEFRLEPSGYCEGGVDLGDGGQHGGGVLAVSVAEVFGRFVRELLGFAKMYSASTAASGASLSVTGVIPRSAARRTAGGRNRLRKCG